MDLTGLDWTCAAPVSGLCWAVSVFCVAAAVVQVLLRSRDVFPDGEEESSAPCAPHIVLVSLTVTHASHYHVFTLTVPAGPQHSAVTSQMTSQLCGLFSGYVSVSPDLTSSLSLFQRNGAAELDSLFMTLK